jgi:hypothetical protein
MLPLHSTSAAARERLKNSSKETCAKFEALEKYLNKEK